MYQYVLYVTLFLGLSAPNLNWANRKLLEDYVQTYKEIAIAEMRRTGIPASIKLAQGILESDMGRSPLASEANNHFGIKCGGHWEGETYFKLDDDKDDKGSLIESCFRAFSSAQESYIAHSEFLRDPAKISRYGFLFNLSTKDYEGWANGLKFAGYATDPKYPSKLINIIESHKLYLYDEPVSPQSDNDEWLASYDSKTSPSSEALKNKEKTQTTQDYKAGTKGRFDKDVKPSRSSRINGLYVTYSKTGESLKSISKRSGKSMFDLLEFNEGISSFETVLEEGEIVFLERKKKAYYGEDAEFYTVKNAETMYEISQKFGVRLESLLAKNNFPDNAIPLKGAQISLLKHLNANETPPFEWIEKFDSYVDLGDLR